MVNYEESKCLGRNTYFLHQANCEGIDMLLIFLGEILLGVLAYRRAKANGTLPSQASEIEATEPYVPQPLGPNATRKERILHWLGIEEMPD